MKWNFCLLGAVIAIVGSWGEVKAAEATLNIPAMAGTYFPNSDPTACYPGTLGRVIGMGITGCNLIIPLPIEAGKTIKTITFYYFDSSGTQVMSGLFQSTALSSIGGSSIVQLGNFLDRTTSNNVQFSTLSPNHQLLSTHTYYVYAGINDGTTFIGIKVVYQ